MQKYRLFLFIFLLLSACQSSKMLYEDALCIENITIIDPIDGATEARTIIIKDGKIHKVSPTNTLELAEDNTIIDGTGKYLMPGLWDAHVHFAYMEELAPSMFNLFLGYGVTSVRDTGGKIGFVKGWKDKALANPTAAPRVMIAGPLLDGEPNVYDGSSAGRPPLSVGLDDVDAVVQAINSLDSIGVDLLKAYEMLTPEQFAKVTALARDKGLKVTGHVPLSMDVISASNAGLNSMEHMRNLELSCASNADELLAERRQLLAAGSEDAGGILRSRIHAAQRKTAVENYDETQADKVLAVLAKNETWQIPTIALSTGFAERHFTRPAWKATFQYLPKDIEDRWLDEIKEVNQFDVEPFTREYADWMLNMVGKIHAAEIDLMAGTDCPIFYLTPGYSLHEELALLVKSGLSTQAALQTATLNPARYFGMEKELGRVQENMWADLLILDANPLDNIAHTKRIEGVIKQGKYYDRAALDALLQEAVSIK